VTFGGSDPTGTLPLALRALESVDGPLAVVAVVGPLAMNGDAVAQAAAVSRHPVEVVRDPADMLDLLRAADLAVTAGGGTLVELAAAGTPAIAVEVAENQSRGIAALVAAGAALDAGRAGGRSLESRIAALVTTLATCPERRQALSAAGRAVLDGRGATRIAERLAVLAGARGAQVT
jgi:spore coat polysaccharide biosynthesis predicted glycosyltransferase SpsG